MFLKSNPEIRKGLFTAQYPVRQESLLRLNQCINELTARYISKYKDLILAFAIAVDIEKKKKEKVFPNLDVNAKKILTYMKEEKKELLDVIADKENVFQQVKLTDKAKSEKEERSLWRKVAEMSELYPLVKNTTRLDFLKYLIQHHEKRVRIRAQKVVSTKKKRLKKIETEWPLFPIDKAPWPLLMPLAETRPVSECDAVWERFTSGLGISRYGRYSFDYQKPEFRFKKSTYHPESYQRILEDGGVCGRLSQLARTSNTALGIPSLQMGQPGHSAYVAYQTEDNKTFFAKMGHSVSSMDGSHSNWQFGDAKGLKYSKPNRVGVEYHFGLVMAANSSVDSYLNTRIIDHLINNTQNLSETSRIQLLEIALSINPYNVDIIYQLAKAYGDKLPKVNGFIAKLRKFGGGASIAFEGNKDTNSSLKFYARKKNDPAEDKKKWAAQVTARIIYHAYAQKVDPKFFKEAQNFLEDEVKYQSKITKSPYLEQVQELLKNLAALPVSVAKKHNDKDDIKKDVQDAPKDELFKYVASIESIEKKKNAMGKAAAQKLTTLLKKYTETEKLKYIEALTRAFDSESKRFAAKKKPGKKEMTVSVNPLYELLITLKTQSLKAQGKNEQALIVNKKFQQSLKIYTQKQK
jgi:hypothetical protein